jgi:hypothetical protein
MKISHKSDDENQSYKILYINTNYVKQQLKVTIYYRFCILGLVLEK